MAIEKSLTEVLDTQFRDQVGKRVRQNYETDQVLYHYTSLNSLMGMVETNRVWMSKGTFLNDSSELFYFSSIVQNVIEKMKETAEQPLWKMYIRELEKAMTYFLSEIEKSGLEVYIFSLSHTQDSLALWYNYAKGEGYNIGFHAGDLLERGNGFSNSPGALHGYVMYSKEKQEQVLEELLLETFELIQDYEEKEALEALPDHFFSVIATCATFFKNPAFKSEEEYRLALIKRKGDEQVDIEFRARNGIIIPYITVEFDHKLPISDITIGPKNNIDVAKSGIEHYLKSKGYDLEHVAINKSVAALRY
ncbi:DUF2971 domain-containing protein [Planococcus salinus]|uniref:DUF2971 domain-containing protein n=1 Tax=Planococcus salinus TaxID=1848460 RepID=A0A3M8P503_9BACL|nr:DUF2971 domain-containing protein [Planococcus salinus]RNF38725.1 DUF2971 domain-containing protein [Planococcus salinus]